MRHARVAVRDHEKHFLTLRLRDSAPAAALARYRETVAHAALAGLTVVYEKVFGDVSVRDEVLAARRAWYEQCGRAVPPISFVEGRPGDARSITGVVAHAVAAPDAAVTVRFLDDASGAPRASLVETPRGRALHVCGLTDSGDERADVRARCLDAFAAVEAFLRRHGFCPADIVRTWIYLSDIDRDYVALNEARREFFAAHDVDFRAGSNALPASTCIEGRSARDRVVTIDVYCVDRTVGCSVRRRLYNPLQSEADGATYPLKPAFARGMLVDDGEHQDLQISGTASIDAAGRTVFGGDPAAQIRQTLRNVTRLLEVEGFEPRDICQATYHFKSEDVLRHFDAVSAEMGFAEVVGPCVVTNICRPDLLFEVDGIAIRPTPPAPRPHFT